MKVHQFLDRYGITENPFAQEDAQSDSVFREHCLSGVHHQAWDKIFGRVDLPTTSVVFGEKGSGKTALKMQMVEATQAHNDKLATGRVWIALYDDFNPFMDAFRERLRGRKRKPERALRYWQLWDHIDAILGIVVTKLVTAALDSGSKLLPETINELAVHERRDFLMLAAIYDRSRDQPKPKRIGLLARKLNYSNWLRWWDSTLGLLGTITTISLIWSLSGFTSLFSLWTVIPLLAVWLPYALRMFSAWKKAFGIARQIRVLDHSSKNLYRTFARFNRNDLSGQPLPTKSRSDERYELLVKTQNLLRKLGYDHLLVFVDRVDEPHLVEGDAERMRDVLSSLFDNKFLKHPNLGFKLLLPFEVLPLLEKKEKQFWERSRLDKQNMVPSLNWTGEELYDIANDRIKACAKLAEKAPRLTDFFGDSVTKEELVPQLAQLRVPRYLFKFLYRLLVDHCSQFTDDNPQWTISRETLQSTLAVFRRDLQAFDRGQGYL